MGKPATDCNLKTAQIGIDGTGTFRYFHTPLPEKSRLSSMYAVIQTGGKQYRVQAGDVVKVELLDGEQGKEIALPEVLLLGDGDKITIGRPTVKGAKVTAEVVNADVKDEKVIAFKFRRRKGYHRKRGFRARHTVLKIKEIVAA